MNWSAASGTDDDRSVSPPGAVASVTLVNRVLLVAGPVTSSELQPMNIAQAATHPRLRARPSVVDTHIPHLALIDVVLVDVLSVADITPHTGGA